MKLSVLIFTAFYSFNALGTEAISSEVAGNLAKMKLQEMIADKQLHTRWTNAEIANIAKTKSESSPGWRVKFTSGKAKQLRHLFMDFSINGAFKRHFIDSKK